MQIRYAKKQLNQHNFLRISIFILVNKAFLQQLGNYIFCISQMISYKSMAWYPFGCLENLNQKTECNITKGLDIRLLSTAYTRLTRGCRALIKRNKILCATPFSLCL